MDAILNNIPCGYLEFNDDGIVVQINNKISEMVSSPRKEIIGSHIEALLTPGARIFYQTHLFPMLKMEERVDEMYLTLQTKEGESLPVLINAERSTENEACINRCIIVQMNRRSEYEDRILYEKKEVKLTSDRKERLLSMMSHELRTPLSGLLGMVDMLSDELDGNSREVELKYLGYIKSAGKDLARLADDILNFAKLESGLFNVSNEKVILEEVLQNSFMIVMLDAKEKGIELTRGETTELKVFADEGRLKQVILNLLTNAVKYTEPGGRVIITTEKDGKYAKIHVEDTGIGIPSDKIDQVFHPFIQIDNDNSGSKESSGFGLGLAITKKLVHFMDGDLSLTSKVGEGSVFTVQIPLAES